ncbi:Uu.00g001720.m01.CDS01 [Anthostomella pinea]|uniref:Uu.00g001720.m01.CDS01 n=1 Tax=Anthostomella pinea TaxID=933095 RepID=A0AAI8VJI4_9PEZI|nr:Uu.00g001720.m01.CDS01 [Anthostomella pinea]
METSPEDHDLEVKTMDSKPQEETNQVAVQKRKASSPTPHEDVDANSPKRAKLDDGPAKNHDKPPTRSPAPKEPSTDRRESAAQEEKKRGKRLFGGLLSTLSQTTTNSQQKRRHEIERRQQAKAHQQRAEDDKHREEKLAKLRVVRQVEQVNFDEQVMRTRHSNLLAMAHHLQTRSRPKIYYLPWELTSKQEDIIKDQILGAEDVVDKEVIEFKQRKSERLKALGITVRSPTPEPKETVGRSDDEQPTDIPQPEPATNNHTSSPSPNHTNKVGPEKEPDRADDVMIEEDEDTVIY